MSNSVAVKYMHGAVQHHHHPNPELFRFLKLKHQLPWFYTTAHGGNTPQVTHSCVDEQGSFRGSATVHGAAMITIVMSTDKHAFPVEC